jgi:hypothetical protein
MLKKIIKSDYFFATLISLLTTTIFFWANIVGDAYFWEDIVEYVYPFQNFAATSNGIPFWNPYTFGGMPFFADIQTGFFYPLNRILDLFVSNGKLPFVALELVIILHFVISQINTFYLAKRFGVSKYGAIVSALGYSFSMLMICHTIHPMIIYQLAWLPLVIGLLYSAFNEKRIYYGVLSGLVLGLSILAGHPQTVLYEFIFIGLFALGFLIKSFKTDDYNAVKIIISTLLTFVLAYGIFAVQLFPAQELAGLSQRAEINYDKATEGSLYFKQALSSVVPNLFGQVSGDDLRNSTFYLQFKGVQGIHYFWETSYYFGVLILAFGLFKILTGYKDFKIMLLTLISLFGFLFSLGANSFVFDMMYNLPYINTFRMPARMMFFVTLCFSLLAGMGVDSLFAKAKQHKKELLIAFAIPIFLTVLVMAGTFYESFGTPEILQDAINSRALGTLFVLGLGLIVGYLAIIKKLSLPIAGSLLALVLFFDLYSVGNGFNKSPENPVATQTPQGFEMPNQFIKAFTPKLPNDIFRVNMRLYQPVRYMAMKRNQGMIDKIMLIEGYNPLLLQRVNPPMPNRDLNLDILNVRYSIGIDKTINAPRFYENMDRFGNAWFVNKIVETDSAQVKSVMQSGKYDLRKTAIFEENVDFSSIEVEPEYKIKCVSYENNRIEYKVSNSTDGFLILSEIYYPSWKAQVNKKDSKVYLVDYCFRAVPLKKGNNEIVLEYNSDTYSAGFTVSMITLLLSFISVFLLRKYEI